MNKLDELKVLCAQLLAVAKAAQYGEKIIRASLRTADGLREDPELESVLAALRSTLAPLLKEKEEDDGVSS